VRHALAPKVEEVVGLMVEVVGPMVAVVAAAGLAEEVDGVVDTKLLVSYGLQTL